VTGLRIAERGHVRQNSNLNRHDITFRALCAPENLGCATVPPGVSLFSVGLTSRMLSGNVKAEAGYRRLPLSKGVKRWIVRIAIHSGSGPRSRAVQNGLMSAFANNSDAHLDSCQRQITGWNPIRTRHTFDLAATWEGAATTAPGSDPHALLRDAM
jgi:hypothetical protein